MTANSVKPIEQAVRMGTGSRFVSSSRKYAMVKNGKPKCQAHQNQTAPLELPMIESTPNTPGNDNICGTMISAENK